MDAASTDNYQDIEHYLAQKLPGDLGIEQIREIAKKSGGNFLYATYILEDAMEGSVTDLPAGISAWYYRLFERRFRNALALYPELARPLLSVVAAAPAPIPAPLLLQVLAVDVPAFQDILDRLSAILDVSSDVVRFRHASAFSWLIDGSKAGRYVVSPDVGRRLLASTCLDLLHEPHAEMSTYSIAQLPELLARSGQWIELARLLLRDDLRIIERWMDQGDVNKGLIIIKLLVDSLRTTPKTQLLVAGFSTQIARLYLVGKDIDQARPWLNRALRHTSWLHGRRLRAVALHELGSLELYEGKHTSAKRYYRKALRMALFGAPVYHDEVAGNLLALSTMSLGRKTIRYGLRALKHAHLSEDFRHSIAGGRIVAAGYKLVGEFDKAAKHLDEALKLAEARGIELERVRALLEQASLQYWIECSQGETLHDAPLLYEKALKASEQVADPYSGMRARVGLGWCALLQGAPAIGEEWFRSQKDLFGENVHIELQIAIDLGLAAVHHQLGDLLGARDKYRLVIERCSGLQEWLLVGRVRATIGLGAVLWHMGKAKQAASLWNDAIQTAARFHGLAGLVANSITRCKATSSNVPA